MRRLSTRPQAWRIFTMSQSAAAPEKMRTKVKVAASTVDCFSAARQSSELLANAIIASSVSMKTRVDFTTDQLAWGGWRDLACGRAWSTFLRLRRARHRVPRVADTSPGDR